MSKTNDTLKPATLEDHRTLDFASATGDFGDATVIRKFGDVPDDLSAL